MGKVNEWGVSDWLWRDLLILGQCCTSQLEVRVTVVTSTKSRVMTRVRPTLDMIMMDRSSPSLDNRQSSTFSSVDMWHWYCNCARHWTTCRGLTSSDPGHDYAVLGHYKDCADSRDFSPGTCSLPDIADMIVRTMTNAGLTKDPECKSPVKSRPAYSNLEWLRTAGRLKCCASSPNARNKEEKNKDWSFWYNVNPSLIKPKLQRMTLNYARLR